MRLAECEERGDDLRVTLGFADLKDSRRFTVDAATTGQT